MRGPYGFDMSANCQTCKLRKDGYFCQFGAAAIEQLDLAKASSAYPEGAFLFMEKQESRGIFILCEGQVKLSISSSRGKTLIVRIAKAGDVLGLSPVMASTFYDVTAQTLRPSKVAFVRKGDFLRFVARNPEVYQGIVQHMARSYDAAFEQLRTVGLATSAPERLARVLLEWSHGVEHGKNGVRITMPLTHEEIGEFIGSSRETVTRTFTDFKNKNLVSLKGSTVTIPDLVALEQLAGAEEIPA